MSDAIQLLLLMASTATPQVTFDFSTARRGPVIGPLHYGIFFEEINHAGDGGLYAELIRNGSMEENRSNPDFWWTIGDATYSISSQNLINGAQKRAMHLNLTKGGDGTRNIGYWGINIVEGQVQEATARVSSHAGLAQRTWHNVTADAGATKLYVDGQLRQTLPTADTAVSGAFPPDTPATPIPLDASTRAWLGRSPFEADARMTAAFFDDFNIYDSALTPQQVLALYQAAASKATDCEYLHPTPDTTPSAEATALIADAAEADITALLRNADFAAGGEGWEAPPSALPPAPWPSTTTSSSTPIRCCPTCLPATTASAGRDSIATETSRTLGSATLQPQRLWPRCMSVPWQGISNAYSP
ncbi:MAG: hypothetical protein IJS59_02220 [Bacteroidaceae bacterium]|nr:hypothetical protein [Bacteroidaceae bacterium]